MGREGREDKREVEREEQCTKKERSNKGERIMSREGKKGWKGRKLILLISFHV